MHVSVQEEIPSSALMLAYGVHPCQRSCVCFMTGCLGKELSFSGVGKSPSDGAHQPELTQYFFEPQIQVRKAEEHTVSLRL